MYVSYSLMKNCRKQFSLIVAHFTAWIYFPLSILRANGHQALVRVTLNKFMVGNCGSSNFIVQFLEFELPRGILDKSSVNSPTTSWLVWKSVTITGHTVNYINKSLVNLWVNLVIYSGLYIFQVDDFYFENSVLFF